MINTPGYGREAGQDKAGECSYLSKYARLVSGLNWDNEFTRWNTSTKVRYIYHWHKKLFAANHSF